MTTTVMDLLRAAAADAADVPALRYEQQELTFAELEVAVRRAVGAWQRHGLRAGDRVAVWSGNTLDGALTMLAVIGAGGVVVPLNPRYTTAEVAYILARAGCHSIAAADVFGHRSLAADVLPIAGAATVVTLGASAPSGTVPWGDLLAEADDDPEPVAPGEIAAIQFTSGTTGRPKGALLRQRSLVVSARTWTDIVGLGRAEVYPVLYPLAHVGGFKTGIVSALHARATGVLIPHVSAASIVDIIRSGQVTVLSAPPTAQSYVLSARREGDLPGDLGIRTSVVGSAIVPPPLIRGLIDEVGVSDVVIGYGLTEATGVCAMTRRGDPVDLVCDSIGQPVEAVQVRVWPLPDGQTDPTRVVGELEVRGDYLMAGYLDDPAATDEAMHDGWLRTGDLGWIGEDGYIRLAGRVRDMVIVGGFNVYPAEVERILGEHPAIREAAVIGLPDDRLGEVTAAFVVGDKVPPDDLIAWCRERLADFKTPRRIWWLDELPRNTMGKVMKADLPRPS